MGVKIVLLGLGFWGSRWLKTILDSPRCELCGLAGSGEQLSRAAAEFGLPEKILYDDFRKAIAQSGAEIAVVVLPGALHFEADCLALQQGIHVITEKPLAMSLEEAEKLLEIKKEYPDQRFMTSQNYRWRPHNRTIKKALDSGLLGKVESVFIEFRRNEDLQGYRGGLANPLLEDMSIHHFDLLRFFTESDCEELFCRTWRPSWSLYPGKPNAEAVFTMKNGVRAAYTATWAARGRETSWDGDISITGEKGCIKLEADNTVRFYEHRPTVAVLDTGMQPGVVLSHEVMEQTEMACGLEQFLDCVEQDLTPETTLEDNIRSYAMVAKCLESAERKIPVSCGWRSAGNA